MVPNDHSSCVQCPKEFRSIIQTGNATIIRYFHVFSSCDLSRLAEFMISNLLYDFFSDKIPSDGDSNFLPIHQGANFE